MMSLRLVSLSILPAALALAGACTSPANIAVVSTADAASSSATGAGGHGGTSASSAGPGGGGGSGGSGLGGGGGGATSTLAGTVVQTFGGVLSGVTVCVYDQPATPCVLTDSAGHFSILVPSEGQTGITLAGSGSGSVLVPMLFEGSDQTEWVIGMPTLETLQGYYSAGGVTYPDPSNGFLAVFTTAGSTQNGQAGISVATAPASGSGPLYSAPSATAPDATLQATSSAGLARFAQVAPGVVAVSLSPSGACQLDFGGWPQVGSAAVNVPIVAGFETHVGFGCN
jgi:hypothetical protein